MIYFGEEYKNKIIFIKSSSEKEAKQNKLIWFHYVIHSIEKFIEIEQEKLKAFEPKTGKVKVLKLFSEWLKEKKSSPITIADMYPELEEKFQEFKYEFPHEFYLLCIHYIDHCKKNMHKNHSNQLLSHIFLGKDLYDPLQIPIRR
jgi:hypothetical protein